jgi:hypothetical protein
VFFSPSLFLFFETAQCDEVEDLACLACGMIAVSMAWVEDVFGISLIPCLVPGEGGIHV